MENAKILIVDDETLTKESKQGFLHSIKIPEKYVIFAHNYEEAKNIIQNRDDIVFCLLDCRIPKNRQPRNYSLDLNDPNFVYYGIRLITELQNIPTYIYSAYAKESFLKKEVAKHSHVLGEITKPFNEDLKKLESARKHCEEIYAIETFEENKEVLHFDYSFLQQEDKNFICDRARKIKQLKRRAIQDILDIGKYLIEVKDKLKHGQFENWLKVEFTWSGGTAKRFMAVAREFKSINLIDLEKFPVSALYVLAAPITPKEAVKEAIARAKQGEAITEKKAKEVRNKYLDRSNQKRSDSSEVNVKKLEKVENFSQEKNITETSTVEPIDIEAKIITKDENRYPINQNRDKKTDNLPDKTNILSSQKQLKQQIISVHQKVENNFWRFENHCLFCGEPNSDLFLKNLPQEISIHFNFPPYNKRHLVPEIKAETITGLSSKYQEANPNAIKINVKNTIFAYAPPQEVVVFSYVFSLDVLKLATDMKCYCWVAEPNLTLCEQILDYWRSKGDVKRL